MALSEARNTHRREPVFRRFPLLAGTTVYAGGLVAITSAGFLRPPAASSDIVVGRSEATVSNTGGDGDVTADVGAGCFLFSNSAGGDLLDRGDIGATCFAVDDEAVAKTNGGGSRPAAGRVFDVDAEGVWVVIE